MVHSKAIEGGLSELAHNSCESRLFNWGLELWRSGDWRIGRTMVELVQTLLFLILSRGARIVKDCLMTVSPFKCGSLDMEVTLLMTIRMMTM